MRGEPLNIKGRDYRSSYKIALLKGIILACTIEAGEIHGYDVYKRILELTQGKWKPSIGTIYKILNEMAKQGLLERTEIRKGQRIIVYYKVTDKGIREYIGFVKIFLERYRICLTLVLNTLKVIKQIKGIRDPTIEGILRSLYRELEELIIV